MCARKLYSFFFEYKNKAAKFLTAFTSDLSAWFMKQNIRIHVKHFGFALVTSYLDIKRFYLRKIETQKNKKAVLENVRHLSKRTRTCKN